MQFIKIPSHIVGKLCPLWTFKLHSFCADVVFDLTCKSVPMNASGGHFGSPFHGRSPGIGLGPLAAFLEGGEPTKALIKDPLVKPIFATSFGVKEASLAVTSKPRTFQSSMILYIHCELLTQNLPEQK